VEVLKQLNIYFYLTELLVPFGRSFGLGLVFRESIPPTYQITFSGSRIHREVDEGGDPFCNSSDSYVFGLYGTKGINAYSELIVIPASYVGQGQIGG
jgi:hypothetical protein